MSFVLMPLEIVGFALGVNPIRHLMVEQAPEAIQRATAVSQRYIFSEFILQTKVPSNFPSFKTIGDQQRDIPKSPH